MPQLTKAKMLPYNNDYTISVMKFIALGLNLKTTDFITINLKMATDFIKLASKYYDVMSRYFSCLNISGFMVAYITNDYFSRH